MLTQNAQFFSCATIAFGECYMFNLSISRVHAVAQVQVQDDHSASWSRVLSFVFTAVTERSRQDNSCGRDNEDNVKEGGLKIRKA
jgi:hypothetical protein